MRTIRSWLWDHSGNSLRRILLSSLDGAAITSIKIDGVLHEFSNISGIREDVTDITLNLKQLCIKVEEEAIITFWKFI